MGQGRFSSEIKGARELDQESSVAELGIEPVAGISVDQEEIVPVPVDVVQPEIDPFDLTCVVVLNDGAGQEAGAQRIVYAQVDDMAVELLRTRHLDRVHIAMIVHTLALCDT